MRHLDWEELLANLLGWMGSQVWVHVYTSDVPQITSLCGPLGPGQSSYSDGSCNHEMLFFNVGEPSEGAGSMLTIHRVHLRQATLGETPQGPVLVLTLVGDLTIQVTQVEAVS